MEAKQKRKTNSTRLRLIVMLAFVALAAVGYFTAVGIGNVDAIGWNTITLICPLGAILAMVSEHTAIPMALLSVVAAVVICAVLGKVFCSWLCPVHFMVNRPGARKRHEKDLAQSPRVRDLRIRGMKLDSRHAVLAVAVISTLLVGFPVFCLVCPVGLTFALVLFVMRLFAFGETTWSIIIVLAVILAEVLLLPHWCRHFCPMGAVFSLMSGLNRTWRPRIDTSECIETAQGRECGLCRRACDEGIDLHDVGAGATTMNDCTKCRNCAGACPVSAISFPFLDTGKAGAAKREEARERI